MVKDFRILGLQILTGSLSEIFPTEENALQIVALHSS